MSPLAPRPPARRRPGRSLPVLAAGVACLLLPAASPAAASPAATSPVPAPPGPAAAPPRPAGTPPARVAPRGRGALLVAPADPGTRTGSLLAPAAALTGPQLSDIVVTYVDGGTSWTPAARTAFEAAVAVWEHRLASPVPITVTAHATTFADPRVLGGAGPAGFLLNTRGTADTADDVYEAAALSHARTRTAPADADIEADFNPALGGLYFGTDGNPGGDIDFESVVLHELGHGLGLLGTADVASGSARVGWSDGGPRTGSSWDLFAAAVTSAGVQPVMSLPDGSPALSQALIGGALRWTGPAAGSAAGGRPSLYAPSTWQPGSSYSHLDEAAFPGGRGNSLMTPVLHYGEVVHEPGPVALGMLRDIGYAVSGSSSYGAVDALWSSLGGASSPLGAATSAETPGRDGVGTYRTYAGGAIYWSPATGAHEVYGAILATWRRLGAELSALGYPTTGELTAPDGRGRYTQFRGGAVYWTPQTGAHEVRGAILVTWGRLGWERSPLGYPLTDESGTPDRVGRYNHFTTGSIYWSPATGAHEVHGSIRKAWSSLGWERSWLGYPTSNEYAVSGGRASDFQGGRATWSAATGQVILTPR